MIHPLRDVTLTPEQLAILTDDRPGFRLIRGAAGSGKTTTALMRLRQLCASRVSRKKRLGLSDPVKVLVLTFNRTLRGYITQLAKEQVENSEDVLLTIDTFAHWAMNLAGFRTILEDHSKEAAIRELLRKVGIRGPNLEYYIDEIAYILGRFPPERREEYIVAQRSGRGRAPAINQELRRNLLTDVIEPYEAWKIKCGKADWNDLALAAAHVPRLGYDVVVLDETQDLSANQMRAVLSQVGDDHVTTFIIDAAQRIYPQGFQWRELGIEIRPQMVFSLRGNHRNTVEIARLASHLVQGLPPEEDGVMPDASTCQRTGPRPLVVAGLYSAQMEFMLNQIQPFITDGETIGILQPRGGQWFDGVRMALRRRGVPFCEITRSREWPEGPEIVALSTIHSAKGLEFDHVLLPGLNQEVTFHGTEEGDGTLDSLRRLLAMGIGRARQTVILGYKPGEESTLISLLDSNTYDLVEAQTNVSR